MGLQRNRPKAAGTCRLIPARPCGITPPYALRNPLNSLIRTPILPAMPDFEAHHIYAWPDARVTFDSMTKKASSAVAKGPCVFNELLTRS